MILDIEQLDKEEATEIKYKGNAWCGNCKTSTSHRIGFDIGYGGLAAICERCFQCNGVMPIERVEQLIIKKKRENRKVQIVVEKELKFDKISDSEKEIINSIGGINIYEKKEKVTKS